MLNCMFQFDKDLLYTINFSKQTNFQHNLRIFCCKQVTELEYDDNMKWFNCMSKYAIV